MFGFHGCQGQLEVALYAWNRNYVYVIYFVLKFCIVFISKGEILRYSVHVMSVILEPFVATAAWCMMCWDSTWLFLFAGFRKDPRSFSHSNTWCTTSCSHSCIKVWIKTLSSSNDIKEGKMFWGTFLRSSNFFLYFTFILNKGEVITGRCYF